MSYSSRRIARSFSNAKHISFADHPKIVIMSDCHRGNGSWADSFLGNRPIYTAALNHYYSTGFTYIELGDGDELWENRRFSEVYKMHQDIYQIFSKFHDDNRLFMLFGNHDRVKENSAYVWKNLSTSIPFYESIILEGFGAKPLYMFHGYQGDLLNDNLWKFSRCLVRYIWRPMELRGVKDPTSAAKSYNKMRKTEARFIQFTCDERCSIVAGHTHKPSIIETDCGIYFNSGSCVHPNAITAIELQGKTATLVKWSICSNADMGLYVCREVLSKSNV